jgi:hypothetical protein
MRRLSMAARLAALLPLLLAVQPGAAASSWSKPKGDAAVEAPSSAVQAMLDQHAQKMNSESCRAASVFWQRAGNHALPFTHLHVSACR